MSREIVHIDRGMASRRLAAVSTGGHLARLLWWSAWGLFACTSRNSFFGCLIGPDRAPLAADEWRAAAGIRKAADFAKGLAVLLETGLLERVIVADREYLRVVGFGHEQRACHAEICAIRPFPNHSGAPVEESQGVTTQNAVVILSSECGGGCGENGDKCSKSVEKSAVSVDNSDSRNFAISGPLSSRSSGSLPIYKEEISRATNGRMDEWANGAPNVNVNVSTTTGREVEASGPASGPGPAEARARERWGAKGGTLEDANATIGEFLENASRALGAGESRRTLEHLADIVRAGGLLADVEALGRVLNGGSRINETVGQSGGTDTEPRARASAGPGPDAGPDASLSAIVARIEHLTGDMRSRRNWERVVGHYLASPVLRDQLVVLLRRFREDVETRGRENMRRPGAMLNELLRTHARNAGEPIPIVPSRRRVE